MFAIMGQVPIMHKSYRNMLPFRATMENPKSLDFEIFSFFTICTEEKKKILCEIVGATSGRPLKVNLSEYGEIVENAILNINKKFIR